MNGDAASWSQGLMKAGRLLEFSPRARHVESRVMHDDKAEARMGWQPGEAEAKPCFDAHATAMRTHCIRIVSGSLPDKCPVRPRVDRLTNRVVDRPATGVSTDRDHQC